VEITLHWKRAELPLPMCWEANVSHSLSCARMHLEHREMSHRCHTQPANPGPRVSSLYQTPSAKIKEELQTLLMFQTNQLLTLSYCINNLKRHWTSTNISFSVTLDPNCYQRCQGTPTLLFRVRFLVHNRSSGIFSAYCSNSRFLPQGLQA